jgi:hypothetical protein
MIFDGIFKNPNPALDSTRELDSDVLLLSLKNPEIQRVFLLPRTLLRVGGEAAKRTNDREAVEGEGAARSFRTRLML